jgi:hypothetical protein
VANIQTPSFVPTLDQHHATNEEKVSALRKAFFPKPPHAELDDIQLAEYPDEAPHETRVTISQVREAVNKLAPNKAPGPDEITNRVLKSTLPTIERHIQALAQASIHLGHFPKAFKHTSTVVLRKPGKSDYTKVKAYRPIALENTLGKVLESIMADIISYLTETHELLPPQHYGGRPGRSAEDALMVLTENIYAAWKDKKVYTAVFMDVAGAFNNVHHERLVHNLRSRRIPESVTKWVRSFLSGRSTQMHVNGAKSKQIRTPAGVPQGSPLSPLLYTYYNADLLDVPNGKGESLGFIDDIVYGVQGNTAAGNARKLGNMLQEAEQWRKRHGAQFETSKYVLVHYTRNRKQATKASIKTGNVTIEPEKEARYLGVILDQELRFKAHVQQVIKRGTGAAMALASIARSTWGVQYQLARQLFKATIAARTDYAACIWHRPKSNRTTLATQTQGLTTIQRLAMKAITGCYKTTPTAAMEIEAELEPPALHLQARVLKSVSRMRSLSTRHPLQAWLANALRLRTAQIAHRSNLENAMHQFPHMTECTETIEAYIRPRGGSQTSK